MYRYMQPRMSSVVTIGLRRALGGFARIVGWWILAAMLPLGWAPMPALALSPPPTVIYILTSDGMAGPIFRVSRTGVPLHFGASVVRGSAGAVDLYLGVIIPDGRLVSWVPGTGGPTLTEGLAPVGQGITASSFTTSTFMGQDAKYTFSGGEPPGLYTILVLVVQSGHDPSDPGWWIAANMVPLIFQP